MCSQGRQVGNGVGTRLTFRGVRGEDACAGNLGTHTQQTTKFAIHESLLPMQTDKAVGVCEQLAASGGHSGAAGDALPRLMVVLAHPDDETLALGGRMHSLRQARFITVTDGVPPDGVDAQAHGFHSLLEYGKARRRELEAVFRLATLDPQSAIALELSPGVTVSDQSAARSLSCIAETLATHIVEFQPEAILTHPYEGGHPDHDACAFAVWAAARLANFSGPILEAPFYYAQNGRMVTGRFSSGDPGIQATLTPHQLCFKAKLLACFSSQQETLSLFRNETERFRVAPIYDFTTRPTAEPLHYEQYPWGTNGDEFCALARESLCELNL